MPDPWGNGYLGTPLVLGLSTRGRDDGVPVKNFGPARSGMISVPGASTCPSNPARQAMARVPSEPVVWWLTPDQASITAGFVVASSPATVPIVSALQPAMRA